MNEDKIKQYYTNNRLSDGQKAALSEKVKAAAERPRIRWYSSAALQIAACLVLAVSSVALVYAIQNGNLSDNGDAASISVPSAVVPPLPATTETDKPEAIDNTSGDKLDFTYYDPAFDTIGSPHAFAYAIEPLFNYGGKTYYLSCMRSQMIKFTFDDGTEYSLREVIDQKIIPVSELVAGGYIDCFSERADGSGHEYHRSAEERYDENGKLRIENGVLAGNK